MNHNPNCPECKGTGEVMLLTSKAPCTCRTDVPRIHDEVLTTGATGVECLSCGDEAHTTAACPLVSMTPCPAQQRDRQPTYTLELRTPHGTFTYSGLSAGEVEAGAVLQRSGAPYDRIKEHFEECQTAARVRMAQALRESPEASALGFTLGELDQAALELRTEIENCMSRDEALSAISRTLIRMMIRRTLNGCLKASGGNAQYLRQMVDNNLMSVSEAFQANAGRDVDFSQIEARLLAHFAQGGGKPSKPQGFATGGRVCGKAGFFRQMYGGNPSKVVVSCVDESHYGTITADSQMGHRIDAVLLDGKAVLAVACNTREGWADVYADGRCDRVERKHGKVELRWKDDAPGWMRTAYKSMPKG